MKAICINNSATYWTLSHLEKDKEYDVEKEGEVSLVWTNRKGREYWKVYKVLYIWGLTFNRNRFRIL